MELLMNKATDLQVKARCRSKGISMVLLGEKGMGKRQVSERIAASDLGVEPGQLQYCPHYTLLEPESGTITGDMLKDAFDKTIYRSDKPHVVVIDDADKMSEAAQDRLLKTLEDGPGHSTVLLVCHDRPADTIMSRCGLLRFPEIGTESIRDFFGGKINETALMGCKGAPGRYVRLSQDDRYLEETGNIIKVLLTAKGKNGLRHILGAGHCLKEKDSANIAENFDSFQMESFFFAIAELFKSALIYNAGVKPGYRHDFGGISKLYAEEELLFLLRKSASLAGACTIKGRFNKNDHFEFLMDLINPEAFMEMEGYYAVC
ncbi:MAG: hypothetical protein K2N89_14590 [Lachnospiraceae bacterium]|nr:hypothetical protein [Lachnospiraceae bacterium]